ncbi:MAG: RNA methyltransferase [Bacteroidaceae bacterium]|nr:RNA methyltransferase [Bacteroidaceae bacterium]
MITKARIKLIKSLEQRKKRNIHQLFVAEGPKLVEELLATMRPSYIAATPEWWDRNRHLVNTACETDTITPEELHKTSLLQTPQQVIALFPIPDYKFDTSIAQHELCLALDGVQDPGNIGTILRIADWFGIHNVICSEDTVDVYNPKAVQATMGALARVKVHYTDLAALFRQCNAPIYGTLLDGKNIYEQELGSNGFIVMGNEGKGLSPAIRNLVTQKLFIPNYPIGAKTTESLNVAIATSIVCSEFRRRQ